MKKIFFKRIDIRNFKATASQVVDLPPCGIVVSGYNGSGKSSILEAITFALGASVEAQRVINQTTKAPASVSLTIEHPDGVDTFTRTLTPTLDAAGKITASTSSYVISGVPCKKGEYDSRVSQLFNTKHWEYSLRPELNAFNKDARSILLAVAGCPTEKQFLQTSNPALAEKIASLSFDEWQKQQERAVNDLGKKIQQIPGRIEELSAMIQPVEEIDTTGVEDRISEIKSQLAGVDAENSTRSEKFRQISNEATALRNQAQALRNKAAQKVAEANKSANKQADEADALIAEWNRTLSGLRRQADQIKAEMFAARQDQARKEKQLADVNEEIQTLADRCKTVAGWKPEADGMCKQCNKFCPELQALGLTAAIEYQQKELDSTKAKGRATVAQRDQIKTELEAIAKKIDGLMSKQHELEARIHALGEAPTAPERKVITETPESLHLIGQAQDLEATAEKLIKSNKLDIAQKPTELVEELQNLNEQLTRRAAATQTARQNEKIQQRISELRDEESELITTQLQHKQHLAMLAQFHKDYANEVTGKCHEIFKGTEYSVILFSENMGNERGSATFLASKNGSTNLSTAENLIFWKLFTERVLSFHFGVMAPILIDNGECVSDETKFGSLHQKIIACVDKCDLTIIPLTMPSLKDGCVATFKNK